MVEKRFGHPISTAYDRHVYENEAFRIAVAYADGPCTSPDSLLGGFNVEKDTVIEFDVQPKKPITLASLGWDMSACAYKPELHRARFGTYTDRSRGIHLTVLMGDTPAEEQMVETIYFGRPPDQIKKKACKISKGAVRDVMGVCSA